MRQKSVAGLLAIATLFINLIDLAAIALIGLTVSTLAGQSTTLPWDPLASFSPQDKALILLSAAAGLFALKTGLGLYLSRARAYFLARLEVYFSIKITQTLFRDSLSRVKARSREEVEWAILRSTNTAFSKILGATFQLFAEASLSISVLIFFFVVDPLSALLVVAYFSVVLLVFEKVSTKKVSRSGLDFASGSVTIGGAIANTITAFREISVLNRVDFFVDRIVELRRKVARSGAFMSYASAIPRLIMETALIVGAVGFFALQLVLGEGRVDVELISVFLVGALRVMSSLLPLQRSLMQLRFEGPQAHTALAMVSEAITDTPAAILPVAEASSSRESRRASTVEIQNVSFSYPDGGQNQLVLKNIQIKIESGSTVAFIGASGAGKSTLADLILGLQQPSAGCILIDGKPPLEVRNSSPGAMSYMPQRPGLIQGTILQNIGLGLGVEHLDENKAFDSLKSAGLETWVKSLPLGLYSDIGQHADSLSGGQIQRIGLARAFYTNPSLLVLDEATSALDAITEAKIVSYLKKLAANTTTVTIAHRLSTIQNADRIFVFQDGQVADSGTLSELEKRSALVRKFVKFSNLDRGAV